MSETTPDLNQIMQQNFDAAKQVAQESGRIDYDMQTTTGGAGTEMVSDSTNANTLIHNGTGDKATHTSPAGNEFSTNVPANRVDAAGPSSILKYEVNGPNGVEQRERRTDSPAVAQKIGNLTTGALVERQKPESRLAA